MTVHPYDQREITLAAAILQGLVSRGEFGDTPFDALQRWLPDADGNMDISNLEINGQFAARLIGLVMAALCAARSGLALSEKRVFNGLDVDEDEEEDGAC